ncbi:MAG: hypothetical protein JKY65_10015 [Planctomycetes bacterium]|nr:hypothetical protein [Planctomycetota bacterium]
MACSRSTGRQLTPGVPDYEIADGIVNIKHTLGVNQGGKFCGPPFNSFVSKFKDALENGLS